MHYLSIFSVKFAQYAQNKVTKPMCSAIMLNSRRHDVTSIERYVDQSSCLFTGDVAYAISHDQLMFIGVWS